MGRRRPMNICPGSGLYANMAHWEDATGRCQVCRQDVEVANSHSVVHASDVGPLLQPHENIIGVDRSDSWLLSLDEQAVAHREVILALAEHVWSACLVGNPAPSVKRMYERLSRPAPGDLVYVYDGTLRPDVETRTKALGCLIDRRTEWWITHAEHEAGWAEHRDDYDNRADYDSDRSVETAAWYVQYGPAPADVCRWTNCSVRVVPSDPRMFSRQAGTHNGDGSVTFSRDDLLGVLADDGFMLR